MYLRNSPSRLRLAVLVLVSSALVWGTGSEAKPTPTQGPHRNPEAQKLKNPEPAGAETVEAGRKLFQRFCASCHGAGAKGDGGMALSGGTPSDLTDEEWDYGSTDGEIFVAIRDGVSSDMLAYKERLSEKQTWQVVTFVRSLGPKAKAAK
ncbi:MAG: c-type cytochrome [Acidobacteriota bacterium]